MPTEQLSQRLGQHAPIAGHAIFVDPLGASPQSREAIVAAMGAAGLALEPVGVDAAPSVACTSLLGDARSGIDAPGLIDRHSVLATADGMANSGGGRLILVTDFGAHRIIGAGETAGRLAADRQWWQETAVAFAPRGVLLNTIVVGICPELGHRVSRGEVARRFRYQPMRQPTGLSDIAHAIRLLSSEAGTYLVAEAVHVDGGASLGLLPALKPSNPGDVRDPGADELFTTASSAGLERLPQDDLLGRRILVTGASSGIGRSVALHLASRGADVILAARREDELTEVAEEITASGRAAWTVRVDLADPEESAGLVDRAWNAAGRVDDYVHGAGQLGLASPGGRDTRLRTFEVNYFSYVQTTETLTTRWVDAKHRGAVVGVSSVSQEFVPVPLLENYGPSKAAMSQHGRSLSVSVGKHGLRYNVVAPGIIATEMGNTAGPDFRNGWISRIPLGRVGQPHEVAAVVGYLISPLARSTTGTHLRIDGGFGAGWIDHDPRGLA